ncbi:MAG: hypothetical protein PHG59_00060 [Patescibacteria group bacterium]|nr:hypothetical protein [Patescibacteria group bacterium]
MNIKINLNFLSYLFRGDIYYLVRGFFIFIIVLLIIWVILRIIWFHWTERVKKEYLNQQKYILLSIDVPRNNEYGPEAIESLFSHLSGIKITPNKREKYLEGKVQLDISLEIIGTEGQIKFLIYTPIQYRDLIEAAIYAAYPEAEISEIEDYTKEIQEEFPNKEYDLWGADLGLYNKNPYPIKTYFNFEHALSKELKDPIIDLLEILGKLLDGEQVWIQFIIRPVGSDLKKEGEILVKKMMGEKLGTSENLIEKILKMPVKIIQAGVDIISEGLGLLYSGEEGKKEEQKMNLSGGERRVIESVQNKISKIAFDTRIRVIYLAKKEIFSQDRGIVGILSAFNAINTLDMNGIEPEAKSSVSSQRIYKADAQKTAIIKAYKKRSRYWKIEPKGLKRILITAGKFLTLSFDGKKKKNILNTEELATLYHFPVTLIKPPLIKKTGSKKGEPPFSLPVK